MSTRDEERKEAAYSRFCNDSSVTFNLQCHCFEKGAEWADQHPREGLWDSEKVIEWIKNNAGSYLEDNHKFGEGSEYCTTELLDDLRKAMED